MTTEESPSASNGKLERSESGVFELTSDTFKDGISTEEPTLVLFYTTWCGTCKLIKPIYKDVAKELAGKNNLRFALFDCTDVEEAVDEYNITTVPTMKLYKKGKFECDYKNERTTAALMEFAEKWGAP